MKKTQLERFFFLLLGFGALFLAEGCGKKGPPEPPEGSTYGYPGRYPPEE